jgi:hypothetical protein
MWMGFAIRHVGKKLMIGGGLVAAAVLSSESGRRAAKVIAKGVKAGSEAAFKEFTEQRKAKHADSTDYNP